MSEDGGDQWGDARSRRFRSLINHSTDVITVLDDDGTILYQSPSVEHVLGSSPDQLIGENAFDFVHPDDRDALERAYREAATDGEPRRVETFRVRHGDGDWRIVEATGDDLSGEPDVEGYVVSMRDVTVRERAEKQFQQFVEHSSDIVTILQPDGVVEYVSPAAETILGLDPAERVGKQVQNRIHPADWAAVKGTLDELDVPGATAEQEYRFRHADGSWVWLESTGSVWEDPIDGRKLVITSRDIGDRKAQEQRLSEKEAKYRAITESASDAIVTIDAESTIQFANAGVSDLFGYAPADLVGEPLTVLMTDGDAERHRAGLTRVLKTGEPSIDWRDIELQGVKSDGEPIELSVSFASFERDGEQYFTGSLRDITERKERQRELAHQAAIVDAVQDPIWTTDTDGRVQSVNQYLATTLGVAAESLHGQRVAEVLTLIEGIPRETVTEFETNLLSVLDGEREIAQIEVELPYGDGCVIRDVKIVPLREDGEITGAIGVNRDITEQAELRHQREEMLDRITDLFFSVDREFRLTYLSKKTEAWARESLDDAPDDLLGEGIWDLVPQIKETQLYDHFREAIETQTPVTLEHRSILSGQWMHVRAFPSETGLSVYMKDISERKERERELERSEEKFRLLAERLDEVVWMSSREPLEVQYVNPVYEEVWGRSRETLYADPDSFLESVHPDDRDHVERALEEGAERDEYAAEYRIRRPDGSIKWIRDHGFPIGGDDDRFVGIAEDVTDQRRHQEMLERLHDVTRQFMQARTDTEVFSLTAEAATTALDLPNATIYAFDRTRNVLDPVEYTPGGSTLLGQPEPVTAGDGVVWDVFSSSEPKYLSERGDVVPGDAERSGAVLPLGNYGVIVVETEPNEVFTEEDAELSHLLAANAEAALERTRREQTLIERDRSLARKNETLDDLNHINTVIRNAIRTVVQTSTHSETVQRFCERLTDGERYQGCCFCAHDEYDDGMTPTVWSGLDADYVDRVNVMDSQSPEYDLVQAALDDGDVKVASDLLSDPAWDAQRDAVLTQGFHSVAAIPIASRELTFGCLLVYASQPDTFTDEECDVLAEAGSVVGHALRELERTQSLLTDQTVEVDIGIDDSRLFFTRLASELGADVELAGWLPRDDGSMLSFVSISEATELAIEELLADWPSVESVTHVSDYEDRRLYKITMAQTRFSEVLGEHGVTLCSLSADASSAQCTIKLPHRGTVGELMDALRATYTTTQLLARRETNQTTSRQSFQMDLLDTLTERQHEVLQAAYLGGFFEWPRGSTGENVADAVGVSPPTFHQHLRAAERKLVESVLDT